MQTDTLAQDFSHSGYASPIDVLSCSEALALRRQLEACEPSWQRAAAPEPLNNYYRYNAHLVLPLAAQISRHPAIIETVSRILGDDILVWACEFIIKEAHTDKHISWHQDLTYWGMASDSQQLTAWLALSEASPESGCMRFLPGSHTAQVAHRDTFASDNILSRGQEVAVEVDERHDVCAALKPGQMSLHHGLMFHASGPNVTDDRRIGIAIRYITPTLKSTRHSTDFAMLVAGANRCAHLIDVCGANTAFGPREMALYREVADHQSTTFNANAKEPLSYDRAATNGA